MNPLAPVTMMRTRLSLPGISSWLARYTVHGDTATRRHGDTRTRATAAGEPPNASKTLCIRFGASCAKIGAKLLTR
jgi:hypothetical protein